MQANDSVPFIGTIQYKLHFFSTQICNSDFFLHIPQIHFLRPDTPVPQAESTSNKSFSEYAKC